MTNSSTRFQVTQFTNALLARHRIFKKLFKTTDICFENGQRDVWNNWLTRLTWACRLTSLYLRMGSSSTFSVALFQIIFSFLCTHNKDFSMENDRGKNLSGSSNDAFILLIPMLKGTRPDTWQSSRGRLGRSSNAKTARNSKMWRTDRRTDRRTYRPTDRHGKV